MHLFNNQHTDSEKIASIKTNRIREIPGKKDEGRPCARYSGYDNACVPSPVSVAYSFLPVAEDITTLPPCWYYRPIKGVLHLLPKLQKACFVLYLEILNIFLKN